jgi:hypothetical protein
MTQWKAIFEIIGERSLAEVTSAGTCGDTLLDRVGGDGNVLTGNAMLVSMSAAGASFAYNAAALADFAATDIFSSPTTSAPDLTAATDGILGVNYVLTKSDLYGIYDVEAGIGQTQYVTTSPTKRLSQLCDTGNDIFEDDRVMFTTWSDDNSHLPAHVNSHHVV